MDVSVILVSYNTKDLTKDCLLSLYDKTKDIDFDVYVVDNNSNDGSVEMIEKEFPQVKLIKNFDNKGFGAANNIAIRKSEAKYIFCLNTDTILIENSVKQFFDYMEQNCSVGAVGCQLLNNNKSYQLSYGRFPNISRIIVTLLGIAAICPKFYEKYFIKLPQENLYKPFEVDYITGADLFIRRASLKKSGLFDEKFFMYFEETDLQKRIQKCDYKCMLIPTMNIIHLCGLTSKNKSISRIKMFRKSELYYFKKHHGKLISFLVKFIYILRYILNIKFSPDYFKLILLHIGI